MIDLVSIESTLPIDKERLAPRSDNLIPRLMAAFGTLVAVAVAYFQMRMQLSRLDALYFVACGLGRLGSFVAEGLLVRGEHVLVVARNEDAPAVAHLRVLGADVYIGHARLPRVLHRERHARKGTLLAHQRRLRQPRDRTQCPVVRPGPEARAAHLYESMSGRIKGHLDIHLTFSMTAIADELFFNAMPALAGS